MIDPFDGLQHLKSKILKTPNNPDETFSEDPLRMVRAAYFASKLSMDIDKECLQSLKKNADRIKIVSQERITNELFKILNTSSPSVGLILLQ